MKSDPPTGQISGWLAAGGAGFGRWGGTSRSDPVDQVVGRNQQNGDGPDWWFRVREKRDEIVNQSNDNQFDGKAA